MEERIFESCSGVCSHVRCGGTDLLRLYRLIRSNAVCLILAVILAAAVYLLVYLLLEGPSREKLSRMPGGAYLVKIAGKLHEESKEKYLPLSD